ncbi:hypothetical protein BBOV_III009490 [Babesia bovis T2Bo]|uniref:hypothetical protein n=1 Tax=Babesia bovis T2Bo TaxID=484906 RepID=UPI001C362602|nr:hypothetical protein BBOV_III009490 [Babesia bovis T2Bo]EDO08505.2 hypothetical protein BBOV_III009490 [Babesia bovis T2Bo]
MGLHDELNDLSLTSQRDIGWKRPYSSWSSLSTELSRSHGDNITDSLSGTHSLKSYLSQIKLDMEGKDVEPELNPEITTSNSLPEAYVHRTTSKYDRVKKLESSLSGIQSNVESKRSNILEDIYAKINQLETKITESESKELHSFNETTKKIDIIQRSIKAAQAKQTAEVKDAISKMEGVYHRFTEQLRLEKEQWKKQEKDAVNNVMQNIHSIREELEEMKRSKSQMATYLRKYMDVELPQLKTRIAAASDDISRMEKTITENTSQDLVMLASFIKQENSQLNELKRTVLTEIAHSSDVAKQQIAKESDERKNMQQRIVNLMEETLKRLGSPI